MNTILFLSRVLLISALFMATCQVSGTAAAEEQTATEKRAKDELDITEAAFHWLFKHDGFGDTNKVYYLSVNGKEPTDAFIKRFAGHNPPVAKASSYGGQKFWFCLNKIE